MLRKKMILLLIIIMGIYSSGFSQTIPFGISVDTINTIDKYQYVSKYEIYYYKPPNYDSINSPILWAIHGLGGTGLSEVINFQEIADRRNVLVVAPTMHSNWYYVRETIIEDTFPLCLHINWLPPVFKQIYRNVLLKENRDSIPVYLIGFSAGGQCVTRYMLIRQAIPDSIPIRMAVSANPASYTFCADIIDTVDMCYPCGIKYGNCGFYWTDCDSNQLSIQKPFLLFFSCKEHVKMYYNENYGVLIGTADTALFGTGWTCMDVQGANRYERAQNFYAFSDSDAIARGTTLKWQYAEVPGVGHNAPLMYNTKADTADTSTIAETLLFDSPYNSPVYFPPSADFTVEVVDSFCNVLSFRPRCANNSLPNALYWDFGDGSKSTDENPAHTYIDTGTYAVTLIISNSIGSDTMTQYITIDSFPPVKADFTVDTTVVSLPNAVVQFFNNTNNATSYLWDFGDSATSTDISPLHQYTYADTFTVSLFAINDSNGCSSKLSMINYIIVTEPTGLDQQKTEKFAKINVFPNPFNESTTISFYLTQSGQVKLEIYNSMGQYVAALFDNFINAGQIYSVQFNTEKLSEGIYSVILKTNEILKINKLIIIH